MGETVSQPSRFAAVRQSAARREHGTRARYVGGGCRCLVCRAANSRYSVERQHAVDSGDYRGLVSTEEARRYVLWLGEQGIGYKSVAAAASISTSTMAKIRSGKRRHIRADAAKRILAVDRSAVADRANIPAGPTHRLIRELVDGGYTQVWIARQLGYKGQGLQFKPGMINARNASRVERLYRLIQAGKISR